MFSFNEAKRIKRALHLVEVSEEPVTAVNSDKIHAILKTVADRTIIEYIGMADMPLIIFLLVLKYNEQPQLIQLQNDLMIRVGECNAANMSYLVAYLHFLKFEDGRLILEGTTSYPTVIGECRFGVRVNGASMSCGLRDVGMDLKKGCSTYETRKAFEVNICLEGDTEISFYHEIMGIETGCGRINSMRFAPVADCIPGQYYEKDGWIFCIEGRSLICRRVSGSELEEKENRFRMSLRSYSPDKWQWAAKLRDYYYSRINKKDRPVWLFMDRPERADDNARVLFKYVQTKEEIDSYYLISKSSADYEEMSKIGRVIDLYSQEHFKLLLIADFVISSHCNGVVENPFWDDAEMFRDLYHRPKLIFLQHGVIKDDMSRTLNRFNTNFAGFVTSTEAERQSILDYPYDYRPGEVWLTGLPRFDELEDRKEKIILIMPSWRQGLMRQFWDTDKSDIKWILKPGFEQSVFFRAYKSLLKNKELHSICKKYGYRIVFAAHPLMKPFAEKIVGDSPVEPGDAETPYRDFFAKGALLITDYSSVAFDFSRIGKPVVYYQFDREQFFREHTYRPGYFDYEKDGLGEVCLTEQELVGTIQEYLTDNCRVKEKYKRRMDSLWNGQGSSCGKIYERIVEAGNK